MSIYPAVPDTHESKASRRTLLLRFIWLRGTLAATLGCYITSLWLLASPAYALDPNKRITQYITFRLAGARWFRAGRRL